MLLFFIPFNNILMPSVSTSWIVSNLYIAKVVDLSVLFSENLSDSILQSSMWFELDTISTLTACWFLLIIWLLQPSSHFFLLLVLFEIIFASLTLNFLYIGVTLGIVDTAIFCLAVLTFAALDSIVGLCFLVYILHYNDLSTLSKSFS